MADKLIPCIILIADNCIEAKKQSSNGDILIKIFELKDYAEAYKWINN